MSIRAVAVVIAALALPGTAEAAVVYNFTLTSPAGALYSGTGAVTLNAAPATTGLTSYTSAQFSGLTFSVAGQSFSAPPGAATSVQFLNGGLYNVTFAQQVGATPARYSLQTNGTAYIIYYNDLQSSASGTISAAPAAAAVPEPAVWTTMIVGFGLVGVGLRRRSGVRVRFA